MTGTCSQCGAERQTVTVAACYDVAVCPVAEHCEVIATRDRAPDWAAEDRWWRAMGMPWEDSVRGVPAA